jgi:hypothetical protein
MSKVKNSPLGENNSPNPVTLLGIKRSSGNHKNNSAIKSGALKSKLKIWIPVTRKRFGQML